MQRNWPAAIGWLRQSRGQRAHAWLGYALGRGGHRQEALAFLAELTERAKPGETNSFDVALVEAGLGNTDDAFTWLNRAVDDFSLPPHSMLPLLDDLHPDPRWTQLEHRLGL
jgi:hypothetical protein